MADLNDLALLVGIDVNSQSFQEFKSKVEDAMGTVADSAKNVTSGIGSAFKSAMPAIGSAIKTGLTGAVAGLAGIGAAAGVAGKQIFDMASEAADAGDRIDEMSQMLGISRQGFQEWDHILKMSGASIDSMKTAMNKLGGAIDDVGQGNEKTAEKFARLGISMDDIAGKSREDIFEMTIAGLQNITDANERAAAANDIFGKSAVDLGPLLNSSQEDIESLRAEAHELGLVMSDEMVENSAAFNDAMDKLGDTFGAFKNRVASAFLPSITKVADGFTMLLQGDFEGGAEQISDGLDEVITQASEGLTKAVEVLGQLLPTLLPVLADAALNLVQTVLDTISNNVDPLVDTVVTVVTMLAGFIIENLPTVISTGIELLIALALGIAEAIPELIPVIIEAIGTIVTTLIDNLPLLIEAAFQIIEALAFGLIDALPTLVEQLPKIISSIVDFVANHLPEIIGMGIEIIIALAGGIIDAIPQLVDQLPQLLEAILETIGGVVVGIVEIGKNIVEGLWNGITSMGSWIKDKVKGFFSGIADSARLVLDIHSPSKVFAKIGGYMGEGVGVGFENEMGSVEQIVKTSMQETIDVAANFNIPNTNLTSSLDITTKTEDKKTLNNIDKQNKSQQQFRDLVLQFPGNVFTDKQGLRKVANDLLNIINEDGKRIGNNNVVIGTT